MGALVSTLGLRQSAVSKHLGVLRQVGVVSVTRQGQHRFYSLNAQQLKPVHDWVKAYESFWSHQLGRIKQRAEAKAAQAIQDPADHSQDLEE